LGPDQGSVIAQFSYPLCLQNSESAEIDFKRVAHYFKLAADQGFADAQFNYGLCLQW
jgi:TPR repeat protein